MERKTFYFVLFCITVSLGELDDNSDKKDVFKIKEGFPLSKRFQKQVTSILMRSALKTDFLPKDSVLTAIPHAFTTFVSPVGQGKRTLRNFLNEYRDNSELHLTQPLPEAFKALVPLPKVLECPFFTDNLISTRVVWRWVEEDRVPIQVEKSVHNSLHCIVDGHGIFLMKDEKSKEITEKVKHGDCLYLPPEHTLEWRLQERVVLVTLTWSSVHPSKGDCSLEKTKNERTLAEFNFKEDPSPDYFQLLSLNKLSEFLEENHLTPNCTQEVFNRRIKKRLLKKQLLNWDEECQDVANEMFQQMDTNKDNILSVEDVESLSHEEILHLSGLLEDRLADISDIAEDQEEDKPKQKRSPINVAEGLRDDYEKELQALLEEGFNEILQEANMQERVKFDKEGKANVVKPDNDSEDKTPEQEDKTTERSNSGKDIHQESVKAKEEL